MNPVLVIKASSGMNAIIVTVHRGAQSFLSGGFIPAIVVNSPEKKLAKCTSVCSGPMHALVSGWGKTVTTP